MAVYTLQQLWVKACEHDGIDPESKFVVFSQDNPWMRKYNTLAGLIFDAVGSSKGSGKLNPATTWEDHEQ